MIEKIKEYFEAQRIKKEAWKAAEPARRKLAKERAKFDADMAVLKATKRRADNIARPQGNGTQIFGGLHLNNEPMFGEPKKKKGHGPNYFG